jgi:hypothetical protein
MNRPDARALLLIDVLGGAYPIFSSQPGGFPVSSAPCGEWHLANLISF